MASERWIIVRKWDTFQHYKDRDPSWIKNYVSLLSDEDYLGLPLATRGVLTGVWLLYARSRGVLRYARIGRELGASAGDAKHLRRHIELLADAGYIEITASRPVPLRYSRVREEKEGDIPPNPHKVGEPESVENGTPRQRGTNPRAVAKADKAQRHEAMVEAAREQSKSWLGRTDRMHENLDRLEQEHGAVFTDQERSAIVDAVLARDAVPF